MRERTTAFMELEPRRLKNMDTVLGAVRMTYSVKHLPCMQEEPSSRPRIHIFKIQVMLTRACNLTSGKADPTQTHPWDSVAGWSNVIGEFLCDDTRGCPLASTCVLTHEHTCMCTHMDTDAHTKPVAMCFSLFVFHFLPPHLIPRGEI